MAAALPTLADLFPDDHVSKTAVILPEGGPALTYARLAEQLNPYVRDKFKEIWTVVHTNPP